MCFKYETFSLNRLIPLHWKLASIAAFSSRGAPAGFPAHGPRLILALAADYGNLGDVALTRALLQFAGRHLPSYQPYLLTAGRIYRDLKGVARASSSEDVVALVGGGNMGDLYPDLEEARLRVVRAFPANKIVSFPQSIEFSATKDGMRALARSRSIYEAHPRLEMFARDAESLRRMREAFPRAKISSAPDTVLSMSAPAAAKRCIPLIACLRQDKESGLSPASRSAILAAVSDAYSGALFTDTVVQGPRLDYHSYDNHLENLLQKFACSRCVVTDRLHGLIFSVITGTPCVVIENNNHKIRSLVETWLPGMASVRLLTNPEPPAVLAAVEEVVTARAHRPDLTPAFAQLASSLKV